MRKIGETASGEIIVEMSRSEWEELSVITDEIRAIASRYDEIGLCKLLFDIFGESGLSILEVLERTVNHIFTSRMTLALHSLAKADREVLEMLYGLLDDSMTFQEIDLKMHWEPGQAKKHKARAFRQLRHPSISKGLHEFLLSHLTLPVA